LRPYNKSEREFCAKERRDIFDVERRKRESKRICRGVVGVRVY